MSMTVYEAVSTLISIVALFVAGASWLKSNKLVKLQIQEIEENNKLKNKPILSVVINSLNQSRYFVISNTGGGSAYQVNCSLIDCQENHLIGELERKMPFPELKPRNVIKLRAGFHMNSPVRYQVKLTWKELDLDEEFSEIFTVDRV